LVPLAIANRVPTASGIWCARLASPSALAHSTSPPRSTHTRPANPFCSAIASIASAQGSIREQYGPHLAVASPYRPAAPYRCQLSTRDINGDVCGKTSCHAAFRVIELPAVGSASLVAVLWFAVGVQERVSAERAAAVLPAEQVEGAAVERLHAPAELASLRGIFWCGAALVRPGA
jgi:hypothetical protein